VPDELLLGDDGRAFGVESYPYPYATYYGRPVWVLGEDGDRLMAAGHGRRSIAAVSALRREESKAFGCWPEPLMDGGCEAVWVTFSFTCGCTENDHIAGHQEHDAECQREAAGCDCDWVCYRLCDRPGLPPCGADEPEYEWWCSKVTADTPGAVPVVWTVA